ncbi:MAG: hypothetical protein WAM97_17230 [Acidimicrobiales bacterium]
MAILPIVGRPAGETGAVIEAPGALPRPWSAWVATYVYEAPIMAMAMASASSSATTLVDAMFSDATR